MFYSVGFELKLLFVRLSDDESLIWTFPTSTVDLSVFVSLSALSYNIALCHYSLKNYTQAHKFIGEIIDRGIREHPGKKNHRPGVTDIIQISRLLSVVS